MRTKPKYSSFRLIHENADGEQTLIYCDEVTKSKSIEQFFGAPVTGSASRFITDTVVAISIGDKIHKGDATMRVTAVPEMKQSGTLNTRREFYERTDKIFETS